MFSLIGALFTNAVCVLWMLMWLLDYSINASHHVYMDAIANMCMYCSMYI